MLYFFKCKNIRYLKVNTKSSTIFIANKTSHIVNKCNLFFCCLIIY